MNTEETLEHIRKIQKEAQERYKKDDLKAVEIHFSDIWNEWANKKIR